MSKRNLLLGTASGKVGDLVFYRSKGEQKTRGYVIPTDAKTYLQVLSRMRMLNPVSAFRALKPMIASNFVTKATNQSDFNAFVSANKSSGQFFIAKSELQENACVPFGLQLSRGVDGIAFRPRVAMYGNPFQANDPARTCMAVVSGFDFSSFKFVESQADNSGAYLLDDDGLFSFVKNHFLASIPAGFTIRIMACSYGSDDDSSTDVWQPYIVTKVFNANGVCATSTFGAKPTITFPTEGGSGYVQQDLDLTSLRVLGNYDIDDETKESSGLGLAIGEMQFVPDDWAGIAVAIQISWEDASGHHVTTSYVNNPCWGIKGETQLTESVYQGALAAYYLDQFIYGGDYFNELMESNPYKGEIQPVSVEDVRMDSLLQLVEFTEEEEDVPA